MSIVRRILSPGEFFAHERFGPETVNRGAVLWECEWEGGVFESGVFLGGIFRAGTFCDGVVWAAWWKGGAWKGGFWHHGFGPDGSYRPRGAFPGSGPKIAQAEERLIQEPEEGRATIFTATVFGDVARVWLACLRRSLPSGEATFEVFDDSDANALDEKFLPDVVLLRRSEERPDFQIAYGDALRRAKTPFLAFVDTDVFWLSRDVWPRVLREFENPRVAAVSCVSRAAAASPGTFAVIMRTEVYRDVLRGVRGEFAPLMEAEVAGDSPGRCRGDDTGDRVARAVKEAGFEVRLLDLVASGAFVRFDAITITRLLGGWVGEETLVAMASANRYFRRGCLGALVLARVHDMLFPNGPRFGAPVRATRLFIGLARHPRTLLRALGDFVELQRGASQILRCLGNPQRVAGPDRTSA